MMLADKVEAAVRTLKEPSSDNIRNLIQKIVNSAVTDGQFEECPLTIQELYRIVDAFTNTLLGIYHHRIEYPLLPKTRRHPMQGAQASSPIITLEMANPLAGEHAQKVDREESDEDIDGREAGSPTSARVPSEGDKPDAG